MISHSVSQSDLISLSNFIIDRFEQLIEYFDLDFYKERKRYTGKCPIHDGDRGNAFAMYTEGQDIVGNWFCYTRGCHKHFINTPIGFIRGLLSRHKFDWNITNRKFGFYDTIKWCTDFFDKQLENSEVDIDKFRFIKQSSIFEKKETQKNTIDRKYILKSLDIPSKYFLEKRGLSKNILTKYDIGDCLSKNKPMSNRTVVPIYNNIYMGCTGRSMLKECSKCGFFHENNCPKKEHEYFFSKWRHNKNFNSENCLYNYVNTLPFIKKTGVAVLVESPINVLKFEDYGMHLSLCTFGAKFSDFQRDLLDKSGAMTIVTISDNDAAGEQMRKTVKEKCDKLYKVVDLYVPDNKNDINDCVEKELINLKKRIEQEFYQL